MIKDFDKQINKLSNKQFIIFGGKEIINNIDVSPLNDKEINKLNEKYKNVDILVNLFY